MNLGNFLGAGTIPLFFSSRAPFPFHLLTTILPGTNSDQERKEEVSHSSFWKLKKPDKIESIHPQNQAIFES